MPDGEGHRLLHTCPWEHESTPIERVWAIAKGYVARVHKGNRKPDQLRVDLLHGFYGGGSSANTGVTQEHVRNFIRSADECVSQWIRDTDALRNAYAPGTARAAMGIGTFGAAERQRYRAQNRLIVTFDSDTESSESSASGADSDDHPQAAAAAAV
jgi:hypothetical protein